MKILNGLYSVSEFGVVTSHHKRHNGKPLKPTKTRDGYQWVSLSENGHSRGHLVHRLVAEAFIPNPQKLPQVNHKDGNKLNNSVSNLEWVSAKSNQLASLDLGLSRQRGETHVHAKLSRSQVLEIKARLATGEAQKSIAKDYPVTHRTVSDIKTGRKWSSVVANPNEEVYLGLLRSVLRDGEEVENRNGLCKQIFGHFATFDLSDGFPLLTTKKMNFSMALDEFLWDVRGHQDVNLLEPRTRKFWDTWALPDGNLEASYGRAWRRFPQPDIKALEPFETGVHSWADVDQLKHVQETLKENPTSRRMAVSTWMPSSAWSEPIAPCHPGIIFSSNGHSLDLLVSSRSNDTALGLPWDLARYALMVHMFAAEANLEPGKLAFSWANLHLYSEHWDLALEQLSRVPKDAPELQIVGPTSLEDVTAESFELSGYQPLPFMPYEFIK